MLLAAVEIKFFEEIPLKTKEIECVSIEVFVIIRHWDKDRRRSRVALS